MHIPGTAIIALTFKCQCSCDCCSASIFKKYYASIDPMSTEEIIKKIKYIIKLGVPRIHFTGGEPLLSNDIVDAVKLCSESGLVVFVETNGLLLDEPLILKLKAAGTRCINISLDSSDADEHDKRRKFKDCYGKAINAIKLCVKHKQNCMISTYATKENIRNGDLSKIISLAKKLKCNGVRILAPQLSGKWLNRKELILDKQDISLVEKIIPDDFLVLNRTPLIKCPMKSGYKIFILPDGCFAPCEHLPFIFKESKDIDFSQIITQINSCPLFIGKYNCIPRDEKFRKIYLDKMFENLEEPLFI